MKTKYRIGTFFLVVIFLCLFSILFYFSNGSSMLDPKGLLAVEEKRLMVIATWLMLIVVVPVLLLTLYISIKYRATNRKAEYNPDWDHSTLAEFVWWGFPFAIILVLSVITWKSSHDLDPFKPLVSDVKPLTVQVVALQWKWLFIYPEQKIASMNYLQIPEKTPINFVITSDAPMNSFWIPSLSGQIYAMPGMSSKLHVIADEVGEFRGSSANISGTGFAGMYFTTVASSEDDFNQWVKKVSGSDQQLDEKVYSELVKPSEYVPVTYYSLGDNDLYQKIVMKYLMPAKEIADEIK